MCTAISFHGQHFYFGRTLDHDRSYGEEVVIMPRRFPLPFREERPSENHHAVIGVAHVADGYPLYYDAMNEKGLCMAGLRFQPHARYPGGRGARIAPFELIPWVLSRCADLNEARKLLAHTALTDTDFSEALRVVRLHWLIGDRTGSLAVESTEKGLQLYEDPVGVLTNDPTFPHQLALLDRDSDLPGDLSSPSRFRRAAFTRTHAARVSSVTDFFQVFDPVIQVPGCNGRMFTRYTSCCDPERRRYCYTTTHNRRITAVGLERKNLDAGDLLRYPMMEKEDILIQN